MLIHLYFLFILINLNNKAKVVKDVDQLEFLSGKKS